jgi:hypothetical protein
LWLESHPLSAATGNNASPDQRARGGPNDKTKPIFEVSPR